MCRILALLVLLITAGASSANFGGGPPASLAQLNIKHIRVTTGSIALSVSSAVTVTWPTAFADTNYTAICSVVESTASILTLRIHHVESKVAGSIVVRVLNEDAVGAHTGTLNCIGIHD